MFWLQWPWNTVWYQVLWSLLLCFLSQNCCSYSGSFMVPYKFLKCFFYICVICHGYFNRDCIESINRFGLYGHFDDVHTHLIFNEGIKVIQWRKESHCNQWFWNYLTSQAKKQTSRGKCKRNLCEFGFGKYFLNTTSRNMIHKSTIRYTSLKFKSALTNKLLRE